MREASESPQSGVQSKEGRYLTEVQRRTIIAAVASGRSQVSVAKEFGIHRNTVHLLCSTVKRPSGTLPWRDEMRSNAHVAVNSGLKCEDDPYKRAGIGVQVLKGLGDFSPDMAVNVSAAWVHVPAGLDEVIDLTPRSESTGSGE